MTTAAPPRRQPKSRPPARHSAPPPTWGLVLAGVLPLAGAVVLALMLALGELHAMDVPGCGPGSACAELAAGMWGRVPGLGWPVSYVGLAYFVALLVTWLTAPRGLAGGLVWIVRLGALTSIGFLILMLVLGKVCHYCLWVHVANLAFAGLVEWTRRPRPGFVRQGATLATGFVVATLALAVADGRQRVLAEARAEAALEADTTQVLEEAAAALPPTQDGPAASAAPPTAAPFTGRYRLGPEVAPLRVVVFSDYQCKACKAVEDELMTIVAGRTDLSLSVKHFPGSSDCNRFVERSISPNACWAARAAEAAGLLGGTDGFWKMHHWLFARRGAFTQEELRAALPELGFDTVLFERTMRDNSTLQLVQADAAEGYGLGLTSTPMVFINGVEFRGWSAPQGLTRALERLGAAGLEAQGPDADRPPPALEKFVSDWSIQPVRPIPEVARTWALGPEDAAVRVVLWGDFQERYSAEATRILRGLLAGRADMRLEFRHFPFDAGCNPAVQGTRHEHACAAAAAAEAAGRLGGPEAFWQAHEWLMTNQGQWDGATVAGGVARAAGVEEAALLAAMADEGVAAAIRADGTSGQERGLRGIPLIVVNGRNVPAWYREGERVLARIVEQAAGAERP